MQLSIHRLLNKVSIMKILLSPAVIFLLSSSVYSQDENWQIEGEYGELEVIGQLTEAACQIDTGSQLQDVNLGEVSDRELVHTGSRAAATVFTIRLHNCVRSKSSKVDRYTGSTAWSESQPIVSVTFLSPADDDNPELVKVYGKSISGIGLRITDEKLRDIRLGAQGPSVMLSPRNDTLVYYVSPERTSAPLRDDAYTASVNFRLNYD